MSLLAGEDPAQLFHSGELFGELKQKLAERILEAELTVRLAQAGEQSAGNVRHGHRAKTVLTDNGSLPLAIPRDRQGTFTPQLVEKYGRRLPGFDAKVIRLFSQGLSTRKIRDFVKELYAVEVAAELISTVTEVVMAEYQEW